MSLPFSMADFVIASCKRPIGDRSLCRPIQSVTILAIKQIGPPLRGRPILLIIRLISNSNWTEWSTIQGVIGRVISNRPSAKREADLKLRARLLAELYDTRSNY